MIRFFSIQAKSNEFTIGFESKEELATILPLLGVEFSSNKIDQAWEGQETVSFIQNQKTGEWTPNAKVRLIHTSKVLAERNRYNRLVNVLNNLQRKSALIDTTTRDGRSLKMSAKWLIEKVEAKIEGLTKRLLNI